MLTQTYRPEKQRIQKETAFNKGKAMKIRKSLLISSALLFMFSASAGHANEIKQGTHVLELSNEKVNFSVVIEGRKLVSDLLKTQPEWSLLFQNSQTSLETDADFKMKIMWTDWRALGKANNADNLVILSKKDFELTQVEKSKNEIQPLIQVDTHSFPIIGIHYCDEPFCIWGNLES